ncbi:MAG: hypothetical protein PWQ50_809 [Methanolobus sp.]|nr:hypothetical protein [Methanolobus sp.]
MVQKIVFLGFCERAELISKSYPRYNILGLEYVVLSTVYPLVFKGSGSKLLFAVSDLYITDEWNVSIKSGNDELIANYRFSFDEVNDNEPNSDLVMWTHVLLPADDIIIQNPGVYNVFLSNGEEDIKVGSINFALANVEPLSEDMIATIKSNPNAPKAVRLGISCKVCNDGIMGYASFERMEEEEDSGSIWYEELPDSFVCTCGKTNCDLTIMRQNLHSLLLRPYNYLGEVSFTRLYEHDSLVLLRKNFQTLLESNPRESLVHDFIINNSILLNAFSPHKIYNKPQIFPSYQSDIVILNQKKELILIELEKPSTRILKQDGGHHSELEHAFKQVNDWLFAIEDHRTAFLETCLKLKSSDVSKIKGVVVAGRDKGYDENDLRKLKWRDFGRVDVYTYDDLLSCLDYLIREMNFL